MLHLKNNSWLCDDGFIRFWSSGFFDFTPMEMPNKIYIGVDSSGDRGVVTKRGRYVTIAAVVCHDPEEAKRIAHWLEQRRLGKDGKQIYDNREDVLQKLKAANFEYYILVGDKQAFPSTIKSNYNKIPFPEVEYDEEGKSKYTVIHDAFAKHGWLVIDELRLRGYKGPTEIRWHPELGGDAWECAMQKVRDHAEKWVGPCDLQIAGEGYPLVRTADIVAKLSRWLLEESKAIVTAPIPIDESGFFEEPNVHTILWGLSGSTFYEVVYH